VINPRTFLILRVAYIVVLTLVFYILLAVLVHLGFAWLPWLTFGLGLLGIGWLAHSADSKGMADDLRLALADCGMRDKEAAIVMGITEPQLSRQLAGLEMLSAWRMANLPPVWQVAFAKRRLARFGTFHVLEDGALAELVQAVRTLARHSMGEGA
jgi:hypothetical protein